MFEELIYFRVCGWRLLNADLVADEHKLQYEKNFSLQKEKMQRV